MVQHARGASEIDPESVTKAEFSHVFRGYSIEEVREFLGHIGAELHRLRNELSAARSVQEVMPVNVSPATTNQLPVDSSTQIRPGTVIDLQSHRLTQERDDLGSDADPELPRGDKIDALRAAERQQTFSQDGRSDDVVPFQRPQPSQRRAVIDELFARLGEPRPDDVEWAREVLIRTGEIPVIPQSPYSSLHGEAETIVDHHERLRSTVGELVRPAVVQLKQNMAARLETLLPELKLASTNNFDTSSLVPRAMDHELAEGLVPFVAAAAKYGAGGTKVNVDGMPEKTARFIGDWLRERLAAHLDDEVAIEVRLRAVYREWKKTAVDLMTADAVAAAFALGLYAGTPSDGQLRWQTPTEGCCGTICHDNALAGTRLKGQKFPSGHQLPPVGPGCRSLVVPDD
ncbi:MAG: DivIVA domain-containing protein [Acidimicrobiales bacterium]|jgi:DivIVA domain-containing protein|nr:DivIVA domain-containing protein [Acidimicrobiales bacterium]|tara:strand:+ start:3987 stop:5189 length:1203 start_codon:yes stop_codon:yes gene_type:complete